MATPRNLRCRRLRDRSHWWRTRAKRISHGDSRRAAPDHPGRHGHADLLMAARLRGGPVRPARRRLRHGARPRPGPAPAGRRPRRPLPQGPRALPGPGDGRARRDPLLRARRARRDHSLPAGAAAGHPRPGAVGRAVRARRLRRGVAGQGRARRPHRDQPAGEDPDGHPHDHLRGDAGGGRCGARRRRRPEAAARPARRPGCRSRSGVRRRRPRRRRRHRGGRPRSGGAARRGASGPAPARLPRHRVLPRAGDLPGAGRGDPARRVRGRGISRRRAQRAAAATGARRRGERPLRPARRAGRREDRRPRPAVLARRCVRHPGGPRGCPGGRCPRHPGRHRLRPRRGVRAARRPASRGPRIPGRRRRHRAHQRTRLPDGLPVQGRRPAGHDHRSGGVRGPVTPVRPRLPPRALREGGRLGRLPLPGRVRAHLRHQGRRRGGHRQPGVPVQRPHRHGRHGPASARRLRRAPAGDPRCRSRRTEAAERRSTPTAGRPRPSSRGCQATRCPGSPTERA